MAAIKLSFNSTGMSLSCKYAQGEDPFVGVVPIVHFNFLNELKFFYEVVRIWVKFEYYGDKLCYEMLGLF